MFAGLADDYLLPGDTRDGGDQLLAVEDADQVFIQVGGDDLVGMAAAELDALSATVKPPTLLTVRSAICSAGGGSRGGGPAGRPPRRRPQDEGGSGLGKMACRTRCSSRTCRTLPSSRRVTRCPANGQPTSAS